MMAASYVAEFNVELNKTEIVYLPEAASAIVIGNPEIADVSVHSDDTIFIVGRGFGDTNLIILNAAGQTVMNADVHVTGSSSNRNVRIYNGGNAKRATYNCAPYCQPSPVLGDDSGFIGANVTQTNEITNTFASGSSVNRSQSIGMATPTAPQPSPPGNIGVDQGATGKY